MSLGIKSNHTQEHIIERIAYLQGSQVSYPQWKDRLLKDEEEWQEKLEEAENRNYIGQDETGAKAYLASNGVVWVEGKPSGWRFDESRLVSGTKIHVCYDGGSDWHGVITIF